ncbi:AbrB/MazE/SpoVT family DNA-binding domain-containing protein [Pollutimonas sp. M17]|uniref:AbrB/MazE/SpoVT family DNA-binding domain-containing protein n=1 Tax=Pollutimonas sp. M17 TaxID=2962065 RepID=UPI0021F40005|nr:AbrB/MazE/SpoVT family DNA-binding domain-containing protein [Pollutimonas sp. M17]UYO94991.1 AbrB/MazE/SpoVT family DNA-binding domain-containing protein [Pollutimonas sp. M17]
MTALTSKGQVTIPKAVRDLLGLQPGTEIGFEVANDGRVYLQRETSLAEPQSRYSQLRGSAKGGMTTDQIMALTRPQQEKP